jgi:hypothetical protein
MNKYKQKQAKFLRKMSKKFKEFMQNEQENERKIKKMVEKK